MGYHPSFKRGGEIVLKTLNGKEQRFIMANRKEVHKCEVCGNIVDVLHGGAGERVCCGHPIKLTKESTTDVARGRNVSVVEKVAGGVKVNIESVAHPMDEKHYFEWIANIADGQVYRQFCAPCQAPAAMLSKAVTNDAAREYSNLLDRWKL